MAAEVLKLDGSLGEGGGQVFRTAISLSAWTGRAVEIVNIRAGRTRPGLLRQHLTALRAAAEICQAEMEGDSIGSSHALFRPQRPQAGNYRFSVGTAGSASLVLQTVLPLLMTASGPSRLEMEGGTHNPSAPPFEFLQLAYLPLINRMGPRIEARLVRHGFFPAGGGRIAVSVEPARRLQPLQLLDRGRSLRRWATAAVARLPLSIAQRELEVLRKRFAMDDSALKAQIVSDSAGPGNVLTLATEFEQVTEVFTGFGRKGVPAERVAAQTAREAEAYLSSEAAVGPRLADQLLLPMAMAGAGKFRTLPLTLHAVTNVEVIQRFVKVRIDSREIGSNLWEITVGPRD